MELARERWYTHGSHIPDGEQTGREPLLGKEHHSDFGDADSFVETETDGRLKGLRQRIQRRGKRVEGGEHWYSHS